MLGFFGPFPPNIILSLSQVSQSQLNFNTRVQGPENSIQAISSSSSYVWADCCALTQIPKYWSIVWIKCVKHNILLEYPCHFWYLQNWIKRICQQQKYTQLFQIIKNGMNIFRSSTKSKYFTVCLAWDDGCSDYNNVRVCVTIFVIWVVLALPHDPTWMWSLHK